MSKPRKSYIKDNGDAAELDDTFFKEAKRGRPALPVAEKKVRKNVMLSPDVIAALEARGKVSTVMDKILREALDL